jgi:S1-C subfamily serine protease
VLVSVNGMAVDSLRGYADILRGLSPGDPVAIGYLRGDESRSTQTVAARR